MIDNISIINSFLISIALLLGYVRGGQIDKLKERIEILENEMRSRK